jgi:acyl carrier protein
VTSPALSLEALLPVLADALECDAATLDMDSGLAIHPAWDSFGHLRVMMALEAHWGVTIDDVSIETCRTVDGILHHLAEKVA